MGARQAGPRDPAVNCRGNGFRLQDGRPRVSITYGTQTGTAERFAKQLGNELKRKYGDAVAFDVLDAGGRRRRWQQQRQPAARQPAPLECPEGGMPAWHAARSPAHT